MMPSVAGPSLLTSVPTIDEVLHDHASALGPDFSAYRNHAYRVVNLCAAIVKDRVLAFGLQLLLTWPHLEDGEIFHI